MKKRVATFPAGNEVGLEIHRALRYVPYLEVYGFTSLRDHSAHVYENYVDGLPYMSEDDFIDELNRCIDKYEIDFIFPTHDDVMLYLAENEERIKADIIASDPETVRVCRSKIKTYRFFQHERFVPKTFENKERVDGFPVFIKPDIGQGSRGAKMIHNMDELECALHENPEIVICEYLPGDEYTIDCFTDHKGDLRVLRFRDRRRIKDGMSVKSRILPTDGEVRKIADVINEKLKLNGAWYFQLKRDVNNEYKLLEVTPRVAGTMTLSRNTGFNYPLSTVLNMMGMPIHVIENKFEIEVDRAFIGRYAMSHEYDTAYVTLEDTLIVGNRVNRLLMMLIYQLVHQRKKIILLSKYRGDVKGILDKYRICLDLFDEVIRVEETEEILRYLTGKSGVYIDGSFSDRYEVAQHTDIPVFDCSEIEALIDWRIE